MTPIQQMLLGVGAKKKIYVDDVFSTYLYEGSNSNSWKQNGIGLNANVEDRMVWLKNRDDAKSHWIFDTKRGANSGIKAESNAVATTTNATVFGNNNFQTNGFVTGYGDDTGGASYKYSSYTFGTHPGFFDIVTWTGNSTANRKISHSLGSVPGSIWIKRLSGSTGTNVSDWICYHRGSNANYYPWNYLLYLNRNIAAYNDGAGNYLYNVAPAADEFTIGSHATVNNNNDTYVAYVFAHDDQRFGEGGDQSIIKCGVYGGDNTSGVDGQSINLGWEPQWLLIKRANNNEDWLIMDTMRGIYTSYNDYEYRANYDAAGQQGNDRVDIKPNGFKIKSSSGHINANGSHYVYIAIRRPDGLCGKPAEVGTDVFAMDTGAGSSTIPNYDSGFPVDWALRRDVSTSAGWKMWHRLRGTSEMEIKDNTEGSQVSGDYFDSNVGWSEMGGGSDYLSWMWKRHAGFDVVTFQSVGSSGTSFNHGLGRVPEMMWFKNRSRNNTNWFVYHKDSHATNPEKYKLELDNAGTVAGPVNDYFVYSGGSGITATTASGGGFYETGGGNEDQMLCMLFASVDGICKVGSYTGSSSTVTVTTGFQPRFVIIKRADTSNEPWVVLDTSRGWGSGNDQFLSLNTEEGPNSNMNLGAPTSTGFTVTTTWNTLNTNGGNFLYYAHA